MQNEEWKTYVQDPRTICKYGAKCYQKNPEHHNTYKHPPQKLKAVKGKRDKGRFSPYLKQNKVEDTVKESKKIADHKTFVNDNSQSNGTEDKQDVFLKNYEYYEKSSDHKLLHELFLVDMPEDFFQFYDFLCNEFSSVEKTLESVNLELIGPYELLLGKLPIVDDKDLYLVNWRFYFDPPEFQAILKRKGKSQYHIGFYRDRPSDKPVFLASNDSEKGYKILPLAENVFAAVYFYLQNEKKVSPFLSMACQKLMDKIKSAAEKLNIKILEYNIKERHAHAVAKTLHGAGIVVPYNKKTQLGYRHLVDTDANIKKLFTKLQNASNQSEKDKVLSELQPVITYANIAVDECDFGTGLEAGIALFCSGLKDLESSALTCLTSAYNLLNREEFSKIALAHIKHRRRGYKLSLQDI